MKKIICAFFVIINFTCFSQNISFNKVLLPYGSIQSASFGANGIVKQGNNYILPLIGFDTANISTNIQSLYFAEVNSSGENFKILDKYIQADTNYFTDYVSFIKTHNNGFCYAGDFDALPDTNYNPKTQHFIMLFDSSMNNILTKIIPHDTMWEAVRQIKETHEHGFIFVGERQNLTDLTDVLIFKTDSIGNQIWRKSIPIGGYGNGGQIEETPDHGFLICGYRSSFTTGSGDPFIIKTDSVGNLAWVKILGNSNQHDGGATFAITQDSNIIVALGCANYTYPNNQFWSGRLNVIKYLPDGSQIWNRMYDTIRIDYSVSKIQILPNNDFIVMGSSIAGLDTIYFGTFLFKFNSNGDSLWRRVHSYTNNYMDENLLYDNVLNSDGGITACGYVEGNTLSPSQQIWILKTDSTGYAPGCEPTGIEKIQYIKTETIKVYPNPATNQTTIAYAQIKEEGTIYIYNMLGQIVYEEKIDKGPSLTKLNIQNYKAGLYKVIIREKGMMIGEVSLVKE